MVLCTQYFPTIEFFAIAAENSVVFLEANEHYCKQSWRNRCRILSSNGPVDLNFPIVHDGKKLITEVLVDYSTPWVQKTEKALESAYYSSPFFEYYMDDLFAILDSHPATLWELDLKIIRFMATKMGIAVEFIPTSEFRGPSIEIHPKKASGYSCREYWQVFQEKFGFTAGLSAIDLLFNEGPNSLCILR